MSKLVLRVECQGEVLGEFPLEGESLVLRLQDGDSGRLISTLTLEPAEAEQPVQPARARLEGLPPLSASGDLFQDETVDLVLSNDDTLARGVAEIRARAGSAPGTINVQLPSSRSEPELLELSETTGASGALELSPDEQGPDTLRLEKPEPLPVDREAVTARSRPGEARLGPLAVSPPEPERTEPEPPLPAAPEQDRSITRNLSDEMQELIAAAARRTHEAAEEGRPTITEPLASEESARPTFVEPDEVGELEAEGPPTRVSRDPFLPQPIAPQEPGVHGGEETRSVSDHEAGTELQDESEPVVGTDFADDDDEPVTVVAKTPSSERGAAQAARAAVLDEELRSARHPEDPGLVGPTAGYDEMPVPPQDRRQYDDDLSLSLPFEPGLTDASIGELSLPVPALTDERSEFSADLSLSLPLPVGLYEAASDDDITLPLPEEGSDASAESQRLVEIVQERTVTSGIGAMKLDTLGEPQPVQPAAGYHGRLRARSQHRAARGRRGLVPSPRRVDPARGVEPRAACTGLRRHGALRRLGGAGGAGGAAAARLGHPAQRRAAPDQLRSAGHPPAGGHLGDHVAGGAGHLCPQQRGPRCQRPRARPGPRGLPAPAPLSGLEASGQRSRRDLSRASRLRSPAGCGGPGPARPGRPRPDPRCRSARL